MSDYLRKQSLHTTSSPLPLVPGKWEAQHVLRLPSDTAINQAHIT